MTPNERRRPLVTILWFLAAFLGVFALIILVGLIFGVASQP